MVKKKQQLRNKRICEHQGLSLKALKKKARKTKSFISESNLRWREFGRADISAAGKTIPSVDQQMNSKLFCGAENGRSRSEDTNGTTANANIKEFHRDRNRRQCNTNIFVH